MTHTILSCTVQLIVTTLRTLDLLQLTVLYTFMNSIYILFYFELFISLGSIDEVNQVVHISWVQPRVLDHKQVNISVKVPLWPLVILRICNLWIPLRKIVIYCVRRKFYLRGLFLNRKLHRKKVQP